MEIAKKVDALEAELAAKYSRIADLEARVSLLEAENARWRKAVPAREATDHTGEKGTTFGRLEENLGVNKQRPVDMSGRRVGNDAMKVGGGEEEGTSVYVSKGDSPEEGVPPVLTPAKCAVRVVTFSDCEDDIEEGVGGGDHGVDDLLSIPRGKKRKSTIVISDSDSEGHGNEDVHAVSPKHVPCVAETGIGKEESDEDDGKTICQVIKKRRSRDDESGPPSRRTLEFGEPKDHEESEDGSEEADSSADFIDDSDCSESPSDTDEEYSAEPEEFDSEVNIKDVMDSIGHKRNASSKEWEYEAEMLSAFAQQPELCLKAVCALYRKQTEEEQAEKATIVHNKKGFSQIDARRGSNIAQFLLDGDASGPLKKTVQDLEKHDRHGLKFCHKIASRYSKQLFAIYKNKEDPYFP